MFKLFQNKQSPTVKHYCDKLHVLTACLRRSDIHDEAYIYLQATCDNCQNIIDLKNQRTYDGYLRCATCQYDLCNECAARPP